MPRTVGTMKDIPSTAYTNCAAKSVCDSEFDEYAYAERDGGPEPLHFLERERDRQVWTVVRPSFGTR
jgi:hypothetical protein